MKFANRALGLSTLLLLAVASGEELSAADVAAPVLEWQFHSDALEAGEWWGKTKFSEALATGPQTPRYPEFDEKNQSALFPGADGGIVIKDHEKGRRGQCPFRRGRYLRV